MFSCLDSVGGSQYRNHHKGVPPHKLTKGLEAAEGYLRMPLHNPQVGVNLKP